MFELHDISKRYGEGAASHLALDGVSLAFAEPSLTCILGPSGCGKTTLLNIMGGLDGDFEGSVSINGVSTSGFSETMWDAYRSTQVGFVFQEPHLIDYLTVAENVRIALDMATARSGAAVDADAAVARALADAGIGELGDRLPSELSGGQAQRVAIARALVKEPRIVLADEPTGSLDSANSAAIMQLLADIAHTRLVVVVTHDRDSAERFATHIIEMNDGKVVSHRRLRAQTAAAKTTAAHAPRAKAKSASAVFELARRHLKNKRGRSIITTLVASIGILCIVLMSAINIGARAYMDEVATNSLISSPIEIKEDGTANALQSLSFDTGGLLTQGAAEGETPTAVTAGMQAQIMLYAALENRQECDLSSFITHLDLSESDIRDNAFDVQMRYPIELNVYDRNNNQIVKAGKATILRNIDPSTIFGEQATEIIEQKLPDPANLMRQFVINDETGETPYELLAGRYPESYDELVIITARDGSVSDYFIYAAGIEDYHTLVDAATDITMGNDFEIPEQTPSYSFDDLLGLTYKVVPTCDYYYKENGIWQDGRSQKDFRKKLLADATELTVVGIVRPNEAIDNGTEIGTLAYDEGLIPYLVDAANDSEIVQEQLADPEYDVLTGESFSATPATEAQRADFENTKQALLDAMDPELFSDYKRQLIESLSYSQVIALKQQLGGYMNVDGSLNVSEGDIRQIASLPDSTFAAFLEQYAPSSLNAGYKKNLDALGAVDLMKPTEIDIYAKSMDANDAILAEIEEYNEHMELTGANSAPLATSNSNSALLARVTSVTGTIVRVLAVLIVIALAMSMFMVFSVTYVSSIERRREIGILRAMGSTRRDIVRLFDYENLVIGAFAGVVGTIVSFLLQPLLNLLTLFLTAQTGLCHVPLWIVFPAVLLGALIAVLAGHIPARRAAASDPVELLH